MIPTPTSVTGLCSVAVWNPPEGRFDLFSGYTVRFFVEGEEDEGISVNKERTEFFHFISEMAMGPPWGSLGPMDQILVQVSIIIAANSALAPPHLNSDYIATSY